MDSGAPSTPGYHESDFGSSGKLISVHQLVRQYVTAIILLELREQTKRVVPFLATDANVEKKEQVDFMFKAVLA